MYEIIRLGFVLTAAGKILTQNWGTIFWRLELLYEQTENRLGRNVERLEVGPILDHFVQNNIVGENRR